MEHRGEPPHKLVITGTGRNGTTFLVELLTALGLPTGFDRHNWRQAYHEHCAAGLEHEATDPDSPYIVKNPELCVTLADLLARRALVVDHAIVPVRDLESAARSRIRIGGAGEEIPGGLVGTDDPARQRCVLAERFHHLVHTLVSHDIPHTFLQFPRFVQDSEYAFAKLKPIFPTITRAQFEAAFRATAAPDKVHTFHGTTPAAPEIAAGYRRHVRNRKHWRRVRRITGWSLAATAAVLLLGAYGHVGARNAVPMTTRRPASATVAPLVSTLAANHSEPAPQPWFVDAALRDDILANIPEIIRPLATRPPPTTIGAVPDRKLTPEAQPELGF